MTGPGMTGAGVLALALVIEAACGYPPALFRAIGHPVVWIGALIGGLDQVGNRDGWAPTARRLAGVVALLVLLAVAVGAALALQVGVRAALPAAAAVVALALLASTLLAQRSLAEHVAAVADGLDQGGLAGGRAAVAHIVGRNPAHLDQAGVVRAAIESLAENFSDGVVAPAFWCAVAGLPGIVGYKVINTADSMLGHRSARYAMFGWASARLDDGVNLPASRLAALWIVLAAGLMRDANPAGAWAAVRRDARHHRSPNAGWPEAAMAGALGLALAGPRVYGDTRIEDGWMGAGGRTDATTADLRRALRLYGHACIIQGIAAALLWGLVSL